MSASQNILSLIVSFLGGGLTASIINWIRVSRSESRQRKADYISAQLTHLYGPIQFYSVQNKKLFMLSDGLLSRGDKEFSGKEMNEPMRGDADTIISLSNEYVKLTSENTSKVVEIIKSNYSLIDPDDEELFAKLVVDYIRLEKEIDENGRLKTPLNIYMQMDEISFMRNDFIEQVQARFHSKQRLLKELR